MDRADSSSSSSGGGTRAQTQPRPGSPSAATRRTNPQAGPALTLEQMRTPAKDETSHPLRSPMRMQTRPSPSRRSPPRQPQPPSPSRSHKAPPPQSPLRHLTHPQPGPYQYDLYPSNTHPRHAPRPASRGADHSAGLDSSLSATARRSHSSIDATRRLCPPSRQQAPTPTDTPKYSASSFDIPATQKRIRDLMEQQNQRRVESLASSASAQQAAMAANSADAHVSTPHYPLTSALTASKGARSIAEMKRDVAFRVLDRTNPEHRLNNPVGQPANDRHASAGMFHLQHHAPSTFAESAVPAGAVGSTRLSSEFTHPLEPSADDRRIQSILGMPIASAHISSANLTTNQLRANNVPRSTVQEEKTNSRSQTPVSFFPAEASFAGVSSGVPRSLPQSAYLATMHAGALRMEHLLRQPKMQVMMDALLPSHLTREEILARNASPPKTQSNVDRLLYETITGTSRQSHPMEAAGTGPTSEATLQDSVSPPGGDQFGRAALLHREARLAAMLALSSPEGPDAIQRMSFDPEAEQRASQEPVVERFFDTRSTLGSDAAVQATTVSRAVPADHPRAVSAALTSASVGPTSNVDVVLADLLGSPSQRRLSMRMTNADDTRHGGGSQAVLEGNLSPLRRAMAGIPTSRGDQGQAILGASTAWTGSEQATIGSSYEQARRYAESALLSPTPSHASIASHGSVASAPVFSRTVASAPVAAAVPVASASAGEDSFSPSPSSADSPATLSLADPSLSLSASQLAYLEASTSVSTQLLQSELHGLYDEALSRKADELLFLRDHWLCLDAWLSWRFRFTQQRECDRVLHRKRHEGDAGYRAFQQQKQQPIHDIQTAWIEQARKDNSDPRPVEANAAAGGRVHEPSSFAASSLLHDVPVLPASTAIDALHRRTFVAESSRVGKNELLAELHAQTWRARRSFCAWRRWSRVERQGKLLVCASRRQCLKLWFKNWRDLMRIIRGEFHFWAQGKQHDAVEAAREAQEEREAKQERRREQRAKDEAMQFAEETYQHVPEDQPQYARASVQPLSHAATSDPATAPALRSHSPPRSDSRHSGQASSSSTHSARFDAATSASPPPASLVSVGSAAGVPLSVVAPVVSLSVSVRSDSPRGLAPLSAHLSSAYTRDQFSLHQEAIWQRRRNEEEQRQQFVQMRAERETTLLAEAARSRQQVAGPLLFQTGSSVARPAFAVSVVPPSPVADFQRTSYVDVRSSPLASASASASASSSVPFALTSPIKTAQGSILHEVTGSPQFDRQLMRVERLDEALALASPRSDRASSLLSGKGRAASVSPLSPPALRPRSATAHASSEAASLPSLDASSHFSVTDDELRANVRAAEESRRQRERQATQNQVAQWHRVEQEKENYRQKVQQAHAQQE